MTAHPICGSRLFLFFVDSEQQKKEGSPRRMAWVRGKNERRGKAISRTCKLGLLTPYARGPVDYGRRRSLPKTKLSNHTKITETHARGSRGGERRDSSVRIPAGCQLRCCRQLQCE